jgi:RNA polymerase sigma-70 factor (ECF subfamily)
MQYSHTAATVTTADRPRGLVHETSDEALVLSIATGDKQALQVLFGRHNVRVFRFILRFLNNDEAAAEDLVSEVFIDVWRQANRFEARSQVSTWLLAIARNKALSALRRRSTEELDEEVAEFIEDPADNPEVAMQKKQRNSILAECLTQLSAAHREIVDLVYYHEKSIDEVAEIIGVPQNTVKTRMFYARKRIAELMGAKGFDRAFV